MKYQLGTSIVNTNKGKIVYDKSVLLSIINLSTKEIEGVSCVKDNFGSLAKKWFSNKYYDGVKVDYENNGITINIYLSIEYTQGNSVSEIAYKVQENVKNGISYMTDVIINSINIHVIGVDFPENIWFRRKYE